MEMKKMIVVFLVIATFALPALNATLEKDFISRKAIDMVLKKVGSNAMLDEKAIEALTGKILISNPIIEEALFKYSNLNGPRGVTCRETCYSQDCYSAWAGCKCNDGACFINSLEAN
uniref:Cyclotide n=1 Tax=Viola tricolor TaxID=214053 RepID=A0A0N9XNL7_9ROSI|nr:cyclotide precursor [Viola tricolor]